MKRGKVIPLEVAVADRKQRATFVEHLSESYGAALRRYIRRRARSEDETDEIIQETFCRMLEYENMQSVANPRSFVFRIALNILTDRWRRSQLSSSVSPRLLSFEGEPTTSLHLDFNELLTAFYEVFNELPPIQQRVFRMRRYQGLTTSEISVALGISVRMTQKHLADALARFHKHLR